MPSGVYNYLNSRLLQRMPSSERKDSRKRINGRELFAHILDKNATSPVYLIQMNTGRRDFLINIKENSRILSDLLQDMDPNESDLYTSWRAVSDHPELVEAELLPEGRHIEGLQNIPEPIQLQVHTLATNQINVGTTVLARGYVLSSGSYRFQADVEGNLYQFQFNISFDNNNGDILSKLTDFMNQTGIGLRATLEEPIEGRVRMRLESDTLGHVNLVNFSLEDTEFPSGGRGLVDYFGLNRTEQFPSNASFSMNGSKKESMRNEFTVNQHLRLSMQSISEETATIGYVPDEVGVLRAMEGFTSRYNELLRLGEDAIQSKNASSALFRNLNHVLSRHKKKLEDCGVTLSKDHTLQVDSEAMVSALKNGSLPKLFAADSPFITDLKKELGQIILDPVQYTTRTVVTYPNTAHRNFLSPYAVSLYSGLFYNEYL